jgi:tRNA (guanine37-N1)-methyltransferase
MRFAVVTLFPEMFEVLRSGGVTARALARGVASLGCWNPRDYAPEPHRSVDDRPYGGGPGMVMRVEPTRAAVRAARAALGGGAPVVHLTPAGPRFDQAAAARLAAEGAAVLLCGRYEGIDERLVELEVDRELSIGDYVLSGGELPAMVVIDALVRLLPEALGHEDSAAQDSFAAGLLDHPHYTRPETVEGRAVPPVLLGGDHAAIRRWRCKQALGRTWRRRPDLLAGIALDEEQRRLLEEYLEERETDDERR